MKTIHAVYENGVFRPTDPVDLPESSTVELMVRASQPAEGKRPLAKLAEIAGQFPENPDLPRDFAEQHDHYLYGTPKRQ
jgi:predicted DNA-binding antitoxin AbrB/MazE fold protein